MPRTPLMGVWCALALVYALGYCVATVNGNPTRYINQDSFGFLLYLGALPVLYLYIRFFGLEAAMHRFVEGCCNVIAAASIVLVATYYLAFGAVDTDSLFLTNSFLRSLGLTWQVDHNDGILGLYTYTAHILMLGIAQAICRYAATGRRQELVRAVLYTVAVILDGHRALVFSLAIQCLFMAPRLFASLTSKQRMSLLLGTTVVVTLVGLASADWIGKRFDFSEEDVSTAERHLQTPALLDKIAESPVIGSGFGSQAAYIRSDVRPFSYEVDILATVMKLGLLGSATYFGAYLYGILLGLGRRNALGPYLFAAGIGFFFYMASNGNQAMSTDSATFHIFLFLLIAFPLEAVRVPPPRPRATPLPPPT
jgi:hypothetical protein